MKLGLLRTDGAVHPLYAVPGCLAPLLRALLEDRDRPAEIQLARARMLERTVRRLQSCRAVTEPEGSTAHRKLAGLPRSLRFPSAEEAGAWLRSASPRCWPRPGSRWPTASWTPWRAGWWRPWCGRWPRTGDRGGGAGLYGLHGLVLDVARRRELPREQAAALLNLADLDARTGRTREALTLPGRAGRRKAAKDLYATGRAMESVGGAYEQLGTTTGPPTGTAGRSPSACPRGARGRGPAVRAARRGPRTPRPGNE
ncbi:hypothetical protein [Streptomyces sp. CB04723]|uniref:hypothetical protein n=1 Tax=Streptomyces sp. CB04723 TaxID=2748873 RepID=UPI00359C49B3